MSLVQYDDSDYVNEEGGAYAKHGVVIMSDTSNDKLVIKKINFILPFLEELEEHLNDESIDTLNEFVAVLEDEILKRS